MELVTQVASAAIGVTAIALVVLGTVLVVVSAVGGGRADATDLSGRALQLARADGPAGAAAAEGGRAAGDAGGGLSLIHI